MISKLLLFRFVIIPLSWFYQPALCRYTGLIYNIQRYGNALYPYFA